MGQSVKSYKIGNRGDQISLNTRNDNHELICWCVDDHFQYQNPPTVYTMSRNEMKGLADFINNYLEKN